MKVLDPLGEIAQAPPSAALREFDSFEQRRVGFIWGQHASSVKFWPVFEELAIASYQPSSVQRLYKSSTWNPASDEEVARIAPEIDFALIGVGG
jgi:hypothetical protein